MSPDRGIDPELLLRHAGFIRAAAQAAIGFDDAVEDAVQETYAAALASAPREPGKLRGWLGAIARNRALDLVRRRSRARARDRAGARMEATDSTLNVAERAERGRILIDAVLGLPEKYRDAILLRYYDGLPPRRIAERLSITPEAARTRVKRGLVQLRASLDERHGGDRRRWALLLATLLPRPSAAAATFLLGTILMKKTLLAAAALLVGVALWKLGTQWQSAPAAPRATSPSGGAATSQAGDVARRADRAATGALFFDGIVRRGGVPAAARVELRRIAASPPLDGPLHWRLDLHAALRATPSEAPPIRSVRSSGDGTFRIDGIPDGEYELRAVAEDGAWGLVTAIASEPARLEILVHGGAHTLRGRIGYVDGRPFRGAALLAPDWESVRNREIRAVAGAACDADGRFTLQKLAPGDYYLVALDPGRSRSVRKVHVPSADVEVVLDADLRTVRGRVVAREGGAPVPQASVLTSYGSDDFHPIDRATTTGADGRFEIRAGRGQAQVRVRAPGFQARLLVLAKGADADLTIELERPASVSGLVRRAGTGEPVAAVPVYAARLTEQGWIDNEYVMARSDADGRFRLPGTASGQIAVFAFGEGWASPKLASWTVPGANPFAVRVEPGAHAEVMLDVEPAARVDGLVLDPSGAPCPGATVTARLFEPGRARTPPPALSGLWVTSPLGTDRRARTDADGRFSFASLVPGASHHFLAERAGYPEARSEPLEVGSGESGAIELHFPDPRWADLTVTDAASGEPVAGVVAQLIERTGERGTRSTQRFWETGDDGRARVGPLEPGSYALALVAPGYEPPTSATANAFETGGQDPVAIHVTIRRGSRITGRVVGPDGVRIAGARVMAIVEGDRASLGAHRWTYPAHRAWCGPTGAFTLDGVAPGRYELRVELRNGNRILAGEAKAGAGAEDVALELVDVTDALPDEGLVVRVRDPGGNLVPQAHLRAPGVRIQFIEAPFVMPIRPTGKQWLFVSDAKDMAGQRLPVGSVLVGPLGPNKRALEVTLPPERWIRGRVLGADGAIPGVEVLAIPIHEELPNPSELHQRHETRAVSGADGAFALRYLGDFEYELLASPSSGTARFEPLRVHAGADDVRLVAQEGVEGNLLVRDWAGRPVPGARLRYRVDPGKDAEKEREGANGGDRAWGRYVERWWDDRIRAPLVADSGGALSLPRLDAGRAYELYVEGPASRHDLKPIVVLGWRPGETGALEFGRVWRIEGVVLDADGEPVDGLWIVATGKGPSPVAQTNERGRFVFDGLSGPELEVRTQFGQQPADDDPVHRLRAGEEPIVLRIDAGAELRIRIEGWTAAYRGSAASLWGSDGLHRSGVRPDAEGRLRFRGLDAQATYTLWMPLWGAEGRHVHREGLRTGKGETTVRIAEGHEIRGRLHYAGESPVDEYYVDLRRGHISVRGTVSKDGSFVLRGLPAGVYPVRAIAYRVVAQEGGARPRREQLGEKIVDARTGSEVAIEIPAGDRR